MSLPIVTSGRHYLIFTGEVDCEKHGFRKALGAPMMLASASLRRSSTRGLALTSAVVMSFTAVIRAGAQTLGPPPPFKPAATIRYGGAYDGPRYVPHRTILGLVKDEDGQVVSNALVYIKDVQAKSTLAASVDSSGAFRFGPLSLDHDYEVWSEAGELKSPIRSVTTFITQNEVSIPLRMRAERNHSIPSLKRRPIAAADAAASPTPAPQQQSPAAQQP